MLRQINTIISRTLVILLTATVISVPLGSVAFADVCGGGTDSKGNPENSVTTTIDIGCTGKGNAIVDMLFAIIRFLSAGVGLVIIGSIIFGGIQYTSSRGDPQATAKAVQRIQASVIALIIFIFGYAILGYLIPAGFLK